MTRNHRNPRSRGPNGGQRGRASKRPAPGSRRSWRVAALVGSILWIAAAAASAQSGIGFFFGEVVINSGATDGHQVNPDLWCRGVGPGGAEEAACVVGWSDFTSSGGDFDESFFRTRRIYEDAFSDPIQPWNTTRAQYQAQNATVIGLRLDGADGWTVLHGLEYYEDGSNDADVGLHQEDGTSTDTTFQLGFEADPSLSWSSNLQTGLLVYSSSEDPDGSTTNGTLQGQVFTFGPGSFELSSFRRIDEIPWTPSNARIRKNYTLRGPAGASWMVVWESAGSAGGDDDSFSVQARAIDSTGVPLGSQFQVNQSTAGFQWKPDLAPLAGGTGYLVVWEDRDLGGGAAGRIMGRLVGDDGAPLGNEFEISEGGGDFHTDPSVDVLERGDLVVAWVRIDPTFTRGDVVARLVDSAGTPIGDTVQVNRDEYPTSIPESPEVATYDNEIVVVWQGAGCLGGDCDGSSILMRGTFGFVFGDGFESGTTGEWSPASR